MASSKNTASDELANVKKNREAESSELRRQLNELTEKTETETRHKNDKIKRLEQELEVVRNQ